MRIELREKQLVHAHGEQVLVWDTEQLECTLQFTAHSEPVHTVAIRNDNVVVSASTAEVLSWDSTTGKVLHSHEGCTAMAAHPYLEKIALSKSDGKVHLLNISSLSKLQAPLDTGLPKTVSIQSLAWSGEHMLLMASESSVTQIHTAEGTQKSTKKTFEAHRGRVLHIETFSSSPSAPKHSDPSHFFSLCDKGDVFCHQLTTGKVVSKTTSQRSSSSTLFLLDDRNTKKLTKQLLPILIDPEGITLIAAHDDSIKMTRPEEPLSNLDVITPSTPVLLL